MKPVLVAGTVLTGAALVALPAQDLPILFVHDVGMIGLSLVVLAMASTVAAAGRARAGAGLAAVVAQLVVGAVVIAVTAVAGYRLVAGGIGWPTWRLAVGPVIVGLAALLGFGLGRLLRHTPRFMGAAGALLVAVVLVAPAGVAATELLKPTFPSASAADDNCVRREGVRYCAIPGYEPLIDDWAFVVEGVLAEVPADVAARARSLPVVQAVREREAADRALATPLLGWGRAGGVGEGNAQAALGLGVAGAAVGHARGVASCGEDSKAHEVVVWWLAGQVSPGAARQVAETGTFADNVNGTNYAAAPVPSVEASRYAAQLLRRPPGEVGSQIRQEWDSFTDPATPAIELAEALGLEPVTTPEVICD